MFTRTSPRNDFWVWILGIFLPRKIWYRKYYLSSRHWRTLRKQKISSLRGMCENCGKHLTLYGGSLTFLDVHHLTYERIWHERLNDLEVLCRACHQKEHKK